MTLPLTICIPTFNRVNELRVALDSVREAFGSAARVVVSDNASTDGTEDLCKYYQVQGLLPALVYFRWNENQGPDRNYLKAIELARTDYCMLLGSDDAVMPTAARLVSQAISSGPDVVVFGRTMYNQDLTRRIRDESFWTRLAGLCYQLNDDSDYERYFADCESLAGAFSYISVLLFRKNLWLETDRVRGFVGSAYAHVAALLEGMRGAGRSILLQAKRTPLVRCRTGNDSFLGEGHLNRFRIDWDGYERLAQTYFPAHPEILTSILARQHSFSALAALRFYLEQARDVSALEYVSQRLKRSTWGSRPFRLWQLLGMLPFTLLRFAHSFRSATRKAS